MTEDSPLPGGPMTAASIADRVRNALDAADLGQMAALLGPGVHWGAPDDPTPPCRNRSQVLRWFEKGRDAGRSATVTRRRGGRCHRPRATRTVPMPRPRWVSEKLAT